MRNRHPYPATHPLMCRATGLLVLFLCLRTPGNAQTQMGNTFSGASNTAAAALCPQARGAFTDELVNRLIDEILRISNLRNRFIVMPCSSIPNCQAVYYEGKPYILYNASFLEDVKRLSFSEKELPVADRNWEALTILTHELGHHFNNHLNNPPPDATSQQLELEADEFAGYTIYQLGGTLSQAQSAFQRVSPQSSYTHPGRDARLAAVAKGWNAAATRFARRGPEVVRDPDGRKDHANVYWKKKYTLFDLQTDEPIFPVTENGVKVYYIHYTSNEDPSPHQGRFTEAELERHLYYKFKTEASCRAYLKARR